MIHYAISDIRFISYGITLPYLPKTNQIVHVLEVNTNTLYIYSICGYFPVHTGYHTELFPMFTPLKTK